MSETPSAGSERSDTLSALYRAAGDEGPPPALDDAIRAAARRAVSSGPRRAGAPFGGWRVPMSIAALIVLSVSLVTLMQEEAPELVLPPHAEAPSSTLPAERQAPAAAPRADAGVTANAPTSDAKESAGIGLRPREQAAPPAIGLRGAAPTPGADAAVGMRKQTVQEPASDDRAARPAQREPVADAFPGSAGLRDRAGSDPLARAERKAADQAPPRAISRFADSPQLEKAAEPGRPGAAAKATTAGGADSGGPSPAEERRSDSIAREPSRGRMESAPVPASPPAPQLSADQASMNLSPAKWLEQIEALRRQGRYHEAKASLEAFRRRHPDYPVPDALRNWLDP